MGGQNAVADLVENLSCFNTCYFPGHGPVKIGEPLYLFALQIEGIELPPAVVGAIKHHAVADKGIIMEIKAGIFAGIVSKPNEFMFSVLVDPFCGHFFAAGFEYWLGKWMEAEKNRC